MIFFQLMRFGIVGTTAAIVHFGIVIGLVELGLMQPLVANVVAFIIAFQVSYWGHRRWTFKGTTARHRVALIRLLIVAMTNLMLNQTLFFIALKVIGMPYIAALFVALAIFPLVTFVFGKFWVFR